MHLEQYSSKHLWIQNITTAEGVRSTGCSAKNLTHWL